MDIKKLLVSSAMICVLALGCVTESGHCSESSAYTDTEGKYVFTPPPGWLEKDFPPDSAWRRISFNHPTFRSVSVLIITGPVSAGYTLENLLSENREKVKRFRQQYPSGNFIIRKDRMADMDVLVVDIEIPSRLRQRIVTFLQGQTLYSLTFMAGNGKQFLDNEGTFQAVMDSFVPLGEGSEYSEKEVEKALLDRYRILAQLNVKLKKMDAARFYVEKGLKLSPEDETFLQLQASLP